MLWIEIVGYKHQPAFRAQQDTGGYKEDIWTSKCQSEGFFNSQRIFISPGLDRSSPRPRPVSA
jgi:hypothetical protein